MAARLWRPWDENDNIKKEFEKDTDKDINKTAISEEMQMAILMFINASVKVERFLKEQRKPAKH